MLDRWVIGCRHGLPVVGYLGMGVAVIALGVNTNVPLAFILVGLLGAAAGAAALAMAAGSQNWALTTTGLLMIGSAVLAHVAPIERKAG